MRHTLIALAIMSLALGACSAGGQDGASSSASSAAHAASSSAQTAQPSATQKLRKQLANATTGTVITIPAGHFHFRRGLYLRANGVTIRGAGMDKTILDFKGMISGPQGLLVNGSNFTIEGLTIQNTMGDGLKIKQGKNVVIRKVRTAWTNGPDANNGAYGLYPIRITNLLVEDSESRGASDSGIYVGQSKNIIVRNNKLTENVAGIEIENSSHADVYGNDVTGNTGGILVFNMPDLETLGTETRVFKNKVYKNNLTNFGAKGTAVASVPAGSGVVINSNDNVEVFDNDIADNKTGNVIVASYYSTDYYNQKQVNPDYNPFPKGIYIHDNRLSGGGNDPDTTLHLDQLKLKLFGKTGHFPDVLWDGFSDPKDVGKDGLPPLKDRICVPNKKVRVLDMDAQHKFAGANMNDARFRCKLEPLPAVKLDLPGMGS